MMMMMTSGERTDSIGNEEEVLRDGIVECVYGQTHVTDRSQKLRLEHNTHEVRVFNVRRVWRGRQHEQPHAEHDGRQELHQEAKAKPSEHRGDLRYDDAE